MRDRNGLEIEVGDWVRVVPKNPVRNRVPEGRPIVGRVVNLYPNADWQLQWTPFGPMESVKPGPYMCMQLTHVDQFDPAQADIVLKWDGTEPARKLPNESLGGTSRAPSVPA
jgi:hypothetical protein